MNARRTRGYPAMLIRCTTLFTVLAAFTGTAAAQEPTPGSPPPAVPPAAPAPSAELPIASISGRVIDALGKPVGNAVVRVETTGESVRTDRAGNFTISAPIGGSLVVERD